MLHDFIIYEKCLCKDIVLNWNILPILSNNILFNMNKIYYNYSETDNYKINKYKEAILGRRCFANDLFIEEHMYNIKDSNYKPNVYTDIRFFKDFYERYKSIFDIKLIKIISNNKIGNSIFFKIKGVKELNDEIKRLELKFNLFKNRENFYSLYNLKHNSLDNNNSIINIINNNFLMNEFLIHNFYISYNEERDGDKKFFHDSTVFMDITSEAPFIYLEYLSYLHEHKELLNVVFRLTDLLIFNDDEEEI